MTDHSAVPWLGDDHNVAPGVPRMVLLDVNSSFWGLRRQLDALLGPELPDRLFRQAGIETGLTISKSLDIPPHMQLDEALRMGITACSAAGLGAMEISSIDWSVRHIEIMIEGSVECWAAKQHHQISTTADCAFTGGVLLGLIRHLTRWEDLICVERECGSSGKGSCIFQLWPATQIEESDLMTFAPDPILGHQLILLDILFDRIPMSMALFDRDLRLRRCNPTWKSFIQRSTLSDAEDVFAGASFFDLAPDSRHLLEPMFRRVLQGHIVREDACLFEVKKKQTYWDLVLVPIAAGDEVLGFVHMAMDVTSRTSYRSNLEAQVKARTSDLSTLLEVVEAASRSLELKQVLHYVADGLAEAIGVPNVILCVQDDLLGRLVPREFRVESSELAVKIPRAITQARLAPSADPLVHELVETLAPVVCSDASIDPIFAGSVFDRLGAKSVLAVPFTVQNRLLAAAFMMTFHTPLHFTQEQIDLAWGIANAAAIAIEHAQLYAQAEQSGVSHERERLARDLHDAVTQTLFSAGLIAEVLPEIWRRDPEEGRRRLSEIGQLTRSANAEMRALLHELRPASLVEVAFCDLVTELADAVYGRTGIPVRVEATEDPHLPSDVHVVLYRIIQEALNNAARHARASSIQIFVHSKPAGVELIVEDDGRGFDPTKIPPDHLGIQIMQERALSIDADLRIKSSPEAGSKITLAWKRRERSGRP